MGGSEDITTRFQSSTTRLYERVNCEPHVVNISFTGGTPIKKAHFLTIEYTNFKCAHYG